MNYVKNITDFCKIVNKISSASDQLRSKSCAYIEN